MGNLGAGHQAVSHNLEFQEDAKEVKKLDSVDQSRPPPMCKKLLAYAAAFVSDGVIIVGLLVYRSYVKMK